LAVAAAYQSIVAGTFHIALITSKSIVAYAFSFAVADPVAAAVHALDVTGITLRWQRAIGYTKIDASRLHILWVPIGLARQAEIVIVDVCSIALAQRFTRCAPRLIASSLEVARACVTV